MQQDFMAGCNGSASLERNLYLVNWMTCHISIYMRYINLMDEMTIGTYTRIEHLQLKKLEEFNNATVLF